MKKIEIKFPADINVLNKVDKYVKKYSESKFNKHDYLLGNQSVTIYTYEIQYLDGFELIPIQGLVETIIVSKDEEGTAVTVYVGGAYDRILARALTSKIADHFISYLKNETTH